MFVVAIEAVPKPCLHRQGPQWIYPALALVSVVSLPLVYLRWIRPTLAESE